MREIRRLLNFCTIYLLNYEVHPSRQITLPYRRIVVNKVHEDLVFAPAVILIQYQAPKSRRARRRVQKNDRTRIGQLHL